MKWHIVTIILWFNDVFIKALKCFRYIYVPLGGSRHGPLYKMLSTGLAFGFVCLWHGGNDYLQYWALMNWAGVLMENGLKSVFALPFVHAAVVSETCVKKVSEAATVCTDKSQTGWTLTCLSSLWSHSSWLFYVSVIYVQNSLPIFLFFTDFLGAEALAGNEETLRCLPLSFLHCHAHPL